eukprot:CAMPEP_0185319798 /NCGR_PEP_ID=MMETSP1363-20130426/53037_1 /TAXON_ID=38817 /ORGANISM="Gephyrocapsa oceanica, Strain RCC1303" /LENGTH=143 /DNA_ID=CAMNT_0027918177 /DNA_START=46 /DNA_END=477 /DNA_ORIENTATION=-
MQILLLNYTSRSSRLVYTVHTSPSDRYPVPVGRRETGVERGAAAPLLERVVGERLCDLARHALRGERVDAPKEAVAGRVAAAADGAEVEGGEQPHDSEDGAEGRASPLDHLFPGWVGEVDGRLCVEEGFAAHEHRHLPVVDAG